MTLNRFIEQYRDGCTQKLNQALINNEVTESSNKTLLHELQEARSAISRLTAHHARSVGWDARLMAVTQEREDMQQERDFEAHRARQAEARIVALNTRVGKFKPFRRCDVCLVLQPNFNWRYNVCGKV